MELNIDEGVLASTIPSTQADLDISPPVPLDTHLGDSTLDLELDCTTHDMVLNCNANSSEVTENNDGIESAPEVNIKGVNLQLRNDSEFDEKSLVDVEKEVNIVQKANINTKHLESQIDVITGDSRSISFYMNSDIEEIANCTNQIKEIGESVIPCSETMKTEQASKNVSNVGVKVELNPESHLPEEFHEGTTLPTVQSYTACDTSGNKGPECTYSVVNLKQTRIKQYAISLDETNTGTILQNDSNETVEFALNEGSKTTMILVGPLSTKMVLKENSGISECQAKSFPLFGNNFPLNSASVIPAEFEPCSEPITEQSSVSIVYPKAGESGILHIDGSAKRQLHKQKPETCPISQDSQPKLSVSLRSLLRNAVKKQKNCPSEFVLSSAVNLPVTSVRQENLSQETFLRDPSIQGNDEMTPASRTSGGNCKQISPAIKQTIGSTNRLPYTQKVDNFPRSVLLNNGMFDKSILKMIDTKADEKSVIVIKKVVNPDHVSLGNIACTSRENLSVYVDHVHTSKTFDGLHQTSVQSDQCPSVNNFQPNNSASQCGSNVVSTYVNDKSSVSTNVNSCVPMDVNSNVPTNVNSSVPTDVNSSVPTNVNISVSTDDNSSVLKNVNSCVPTDVNSNVPTNVNSIVPTDVKNSVPTNVNSSVPTDVNSSAPTDINISVSTNVNNSVLTDVSISIPAYVNNSACGPTGVNAVYSKCVDTGSITCKDINTNPLFQNMKIISSSVYKIDVTAAAAYSILQTPVDRVQEKTGDDTYISSQILANMFKNACQNSISDQSSYCAGTSNTKKKQTKGKPRPKKRSAKTGKPTSSQDEADIVKKVGEEVLEEKDNVKCVQEKDRDDLEEDDFEIFLNSSSSDDELFDVNCHSNQNDPDFIPFSEDDSDCNVNKSDSESSEKDSEDNMKEIVDGLKKVDPKLTKQYLEEHKEKYRIIAFRKSSRYKCLLCPESDYFKTAARQQMAQHMSLHIDGYLSCEQCDFVGVSLKTMKAHKEKHIYKPEFTCRVCGDGFHELTCLYGHLHTVHDMERCMTYSCSMCDDTFHIPKLYISHCRVRHKAQTLVQCDDCTQYFVSKEIYQLHLDREQCNKTAFTCEYCGKRYSTKHDVSMHIRKSHEKVFRHFCDQCDYKSDRRLFLKLHLKTHTGEHDIKCTLCDFSCIRSMQLTSHMRTHTGEKPYKCDLCKYAAGWNVQLKSHRAHHFSPNQVMCDKCEIVYDNEQGLHRHNKKVHTEDMVEETSTESINVSKMKRKTNETAEKSDERRLTKKHKPETRKPNDDRSDDNEARSLRLKKKKQLKVNTNKTRRKR